MNDEQLKYYLLGILGLVIVSGMAIARLYGVVGGLEDSEIPYGQSGYKVAFLEEDGVQGIVDAQDSRLKLEDSLRFADLPTVREVQQQYVDEVEAGASSGLAMSESLEVVAPNAQPVVPDQGESSVVEPAAVAIASVQSEPNAVDQPLNASTATETAAIEPAAEPRVEAAPKWWVQLGTFGIRENALRVYDKTASAGYKTVIDNIQRNGRTLHVVRIPTNGDRKQASQLVNSIHEEFGFDAIVVRF